MITFIKLENLDEREIATKKISRESLEFSFEAMTLKNGIR